MKLHSCCWEYLFEGTEVPIDTICGSIHHDFGRAIASNIVPNRNEVINPVKVFDRDTVLHLRIPFSFFLLPIFFFGFSQAHHISWFNTIIVFIALHFFIYPGSNVYNSYMDKDTGSIGGLENPPPATPKLYHASIWMDTAGILLSLLVGWQLALIMLLYIGISKAYSWHGIRIKRYPLLSWIIVALFQGGYTYMLVNMSVTGNFSYLWFSSMNINTFIISSLLVGAFYPLTQVYQHEEDGKRGDRTLSLVLGVKGTFLFSAALFITAVVLMYDYMITYRNLMHFILFIGCLAPVIIYFIWWFMRVLNNTQHANFRNTMRINKISAACMITCFVMLSLL
jgi:1,4-dihydroxy-2-naphthoate octaprenyltransferase